jgi:hypothetical protein
MRYSLMSAAVCLGVALSAGAAFAQADDTTCSKMDAQVRTALQGATQSSNYDAAVKEHNTGRQFCTNGYYKVGTEHYADALKLLGAERTGNSDNNTPGSGA